MVILLFVVVAGALLTVAGVRRRGTDLPERIVAAAVTWLPADRRGWGEALVAELAAVPGRGRRWRFAAGVLRITLFPPAARPGSAQVTASVAALVTAAATVTAIIVLPTMSVFVAVLGLLVTGCATAVASRWQGFPVAPASLAAGALAVGGVLGVVGAVLSVAVAHPAATRDPTHLYAIALALLLCGYLIGGLAAGSRGGPDGVGATADRAARVGLWGAIAGAGLSVVVSAVVLPLGAVSGLVPPIMAGAALLTAVVVAGLTRSRAAGARAGLLVAVLGAPVEFAVAVIGQERGSLVLTNAYDMAAYPRSGFPDVASYLLSDALGGNIVSLAVTPVFMYAFAALGAAVAARSPGWSRTSARRRPGRTPR